MTNLGNLGPDVPIDTNIAGGMQSEVEYRFDLIDWSTLFELARVVAYGSKKYDPWNWRLIPINDHLNHALIHIGAYLVGDDQDNHLQHAFTRLMFALSMKLNPSYQARMDPRPETHLKELIRLTDELIALQEKEVNDAHSNGSV